MFNILQRKKLRNNYLSTLALKTWDNNKRRHLTTGTGTHHYEKYTNSERSTLADDSLNEFKILKEITSTGSEFHEAITRELKKVKTSINPLSVAA